MMINETRILNEFIELVSVPLSLIHISEPTRH